ncbi:MAG: hypothetical protein VCF24_12745, partial [Candidatus Latescibacterota bacterium]
MVRGGRRQHAVIAAPEAAVGSPLPADPASPAYHTSASRSRSILSNCDFVLVGAPQWPFEWSD